MNRETLKALRGSIRKWEKIVDGTDEDRGHRNCPLCALFFDDNCRGCPVSDATGQCGCNDTPYEAWVDANAEHGRLYGYNRIHDDDAAIAAVLELEWLRSLLPGAK